MNIRWLTFLAAALAALELPKALAWVQSQCAACPDQFKGKLVCAFLNGCHLEMEYCALMVFNCGRQLHHKHLILVKNEGRCESVRGYKCVVMDF
ncbi:uncharacterized protein LOC108029924 [Drosophila biarmipes]|uniref:uncharacterized protein LOC108029924 n=1 Tax=Drosophila biarmipes TaxID=125945 RepID=UPI0007E7E9E9|nr:uncharacterized protein LOC108029924 [Drosophila biarmipes]